MKTESIRSAGESKEDFLARQIPEVLIKFTGKPITPEYVAELRARLIEAQRTGHVQVLSKRPQIRRRTVIPFIKKYAKGIITGIGMATALATALGLTHYHWVAIILGVLSTYGVVRVPNEKAASAASPARPAAR